MPLAHNLFRPGARLAAAFWADCASLSAATLDGDIAQSIVLMGILTANAPHPDRAFIVNEVAASSERAPISVYRLAQNLGLPYETTRRHVLRLEERGFCQRDDSGAYIPKSALEGPQLSGLVSQFALKASELHQTFQNAGARLSSTPRLDDMAHERRVAGLAAAYYLKGVRIATTAIGVGPIHAMVHFTIMRTNLAHLEDAPSDMLGEPERVIPDDVRRPVSVYAVARDLGLPYETTRRHVGVMVNLGLVSRNADGGLIVPAAQLETPAMVTCVKDTVQATLDFLTSAFPAPAH